MLRDHRPLDRPPVDAAAAPAPQTARTWPRSQRCAGSASSRGCQSIDTVNSGDGDRQGEAVHARRAASPCGARARWRPGRSRGRAPARPRSRRRPRRSPGPARAARGRRRSAPRPALARDRRRAGRPRSARRSTARAAQRMPGAHDADEAVAEQRLARAARGRSPARRPRSPGRRCPSRSGVLSLVGLLARSAAARRGASAPTRATSSGPKFSTKPSLVRSVNVRSQRGEVGRLGRAQDGLGVLHQRADPLAQLERPRCGHQPTPGPHQQRVAGRLAQARQRPAHRRRAEPQPPRRAASRCPPSAARRG